MHRTDPSRRRPSIGAVAAIAFGALAASVAGWPTAEAGATPRPPFARHGEGLLAPSPQAEAGEAFLAQRYAEAFGRFAALADAGDAPSAWMALTMVSNGPALFGADWSATPGQLRRWRALATRHLEQRSALIPLHDRGE